MRDEYKKILVAVDGSDQSKEAIHEAVAIAKRNKTSLFVLHVKEQMSPKALENLETESKEIIAEVEVLINDEVEFEVHAFTGNPKKEIINFAKQFELDLIVVGSNGKGLLDRMLVGSTTSYVVNHAPCNVMVVK